MKYVAMLLLFVAGVVHAQTVCTTQPVFTPYGMQICTTCCTNGVCTTFCG